METSHGSLLPGTCNTSFSVENKDTGATVNKKADMTRQDKGKTSKATQSKTTSKATEE